jgi:hypothetical protein
LCLEFWATKIINERSFAVFDFDLGLLVVGRSQLADEIKVYEALRIKIKNKLLVLWFWNQRFAFLFRYHFVIVAVFDLTLLVVTGLFWKRINDEKK